MSEMDIEVFVREDKSWFFRLALYSEKKKTRMSGARLLSTADVEGTADKLPYCIEVSGGALAEYQNEKYGDKHDPEECARGALEAYRKLISDLENKLHSPKIASPEA